MAPATPPTIGRCNLCKQHKRIKGLDFCGDSVINSLEFCPFPELKFNCQKCEKYINGFCTIHERNDFVSPKIIVRCPKWGKENGNYASKFK